MPQLGESVTEGTVTRWLKKEGELVTADEPLLEVSTDKVDTEIPSPATGILRGIVVDEDETVAVGAQLAMIEGSEEAAGGGAPAAAPAAPQAAAPPAPPQPLEPEPPLPTPTPAPANGGSPASASTWAWNSAPATPTPGYMPPAAPAPAAAPARPYVPGPSSFGATPPPSTAPPAPPAPAPAAAPAWTPAPTQAAPTPAPAPAPAAAEPEPVGAYPEPTPLPSGESPYVTPLVRKLATEHAVPLESIVGTGVGGRIRKQDVLDAARRQREAEAAAAQAAAEAAAAQAEAEAAATAPPVAAPMTVAPETVAPETAPATPARTRPVLVPSALRGTTQRMSRPRQVIAKRMVESLQTSAQLTTVVEVDVTNIARLRERAKADFEAREGVKLTFLPFFAQATVEALKVHPKLNSVIDAENAQVTYHDAEHLGIAVDTERGLMVPVVHNAGDLNIGGLARKISDVAERTRSGQVGPDELAGGTFTLTNTGSRGALFDTPIINQPQVGILGVGTVVKRPVVMEDPALGEVIAVRSMVYLALTYDHRLVDGADAARFLVTVKSRLEEGAFEAELGL
jgi:2-oxoglutarate dehydrogenase E2 component (dihydrolipoamide succinyltransferase)